MNKFPHTYINELIKARIPVIVSPRKYNPTQLELILACAKSNKGQVTIKHAGDMNPNELLQFAEAYEGNLVLDFSE